MEGHRYFEYFVGPWSGSFRCKSSASIVKQDDILAEFGFEIRLGS